MRVLRILFLLISAILFGACGAAERPVSKQIVVTIPPLGGLVEKIVGDDYDVVVLLPSGSSPETYSPTPRQITSLNTAQYIFATGTLNFEKEIIKHIDNECIGVVCAGAGIELIAGECSHSDGHRRHDCEADEAAHGHYHHGTDPHIWLSTRNLEQMVDNMAQAIISDHPDSLKYVANYEALKEELQYRQNAYTEALQGASRAFLIYHPALGYFATEYGLEQVALENEGKNPTPATLAEVVGKVQREGLKVMFYQQEYPLDVVKPIAEILGVNLVKINPLNYDIVSELDAIIKLLTNNNE